MADFMYRFRRGLMALALLSACAMTAQTAQAGRVPAGTSIGSAVDVFYRVEGVEITLTARSNIPLVTVEPARTASDIELMREAIDDVDAVPASFGTVTYAPDPDDATVFTPQETMPVDTSVPVNLSPGMVFVEGDVIFFHLNDPGRNHLATVVETVDIALDGANGDREVFRIGATGPDSADFFGYALAVPKEQAVPGDGRIAVESNGLVTLTYDDPFDNTDTVTAIVSVEPRLKVFDAITGEPVDGAALKVFDADTGAEVALTGLDGRSALIGPVVSGASMRDTRGRIYEAKPGEARLMYLPVGRYRVEVEPPRSHVFPSDTPVEALRELPNGPYRISDGARGLTFDHTAAGPPRFDIPLDRRGVLVLRKSVSDDRVALGDFVTFTLTLENDDDRAALSATIADTLPPGFRYEPGTLRIEEEIVDDPVVGDDGGSMTFPVGDLLKGETRTARYVARVGALARLGPTGSSAYARALGGFRSNRAEATLTVIDELGLGSTTVLGRVVVGACGTPGEGLAGARLYLENGRHIVTDERGRFHIDGLGTGTHVLRLDEHALDDDLALTACVGDLRPGETARQRRLSIRGGQMRNLTFRLKRGRRAEAPQTAVAAPEEAMTYDEAFLETLEKKLQIVYPAEGASMDDPSLRIAVAYPMGKRVSLRVGGQPVSGLSAERTIASRKAQMAMKRWRGIDLPDGETVVEAVITDANGVETEIVRQSIHYVTEPARAEFLPDLSTLVADGKTRPRIALRLTDKAGRPVHGGLRVPVALDPPYQARGAQARFENNPLTASDATLAALTVETDGIGYLDLVPTTRSGEALLRLALADGEKIVRPWLTPAPRPWVLVALAEGTASHRTISGNMEAASRAGLDNGIVLDGRAAFFAKGAIRGDWLLTLAYDSDKDWGERLAPFADTIDPDAYYPVYGDAGTQGSSAPSGYPLYVRLERGQFHATFGDFETGLNRTGLATYERSLSGLKTVYEGDRYSIVAFAADADQSFRRVEIPVNAGVGPYDLGARDILRNTEKVRLITRDRDLLSQVIREVTLAPFVDYMMDYRDGTIQLRSPPGATDENFNPIIMTVDYELAAPDMNAITAGGRAAARFLDDTLEIGATALHEAGYAAGASGDLVALDAKARIGRHIDIEAEAAASRADIDNETREGMAWRAEARFTDGDHRARVYLREAGTGFGIAQQSIADAGRRVIGAELRSRFTPFASENAAPDEAFVLSAQVSRDEDLRTGGRRDMAEALVSRGFTLTGHGRGDVAFGYRGMRDRLTDGATREVHSLVARGSMEVLESRLRLSVEREQAVARSGTGWDPDSVTLTLDARLTDWLRARVSVEAFDGETVDAANIHGALVAEPWSGATVHFGLGGLRDALGGAPEQIAATMGVGQSVSLTENLSATLSAEHVQQLGGAASPAATLFTNAQPAETATNLSAGLGYGAERWSASVRLDLRRSESADSARAFAGAVGDVTDALTLSLGADAGISRPDTGREQRSAAVRFGMAYRPEDGPLSALYKLEAEHSDGSAWQTKIISSLTGEMAVTDRITLAGAHGLRYLDTEIDGQRFDSVTQFAGFDTYFAFNRHWSVGLHGNLLVGGMGEETSYGYGASISFSPRKGMSLRAGYNLEGFEDDDFGAASAAAQGPFVAFSFDINEDDVAPVFGALRGVF